MSCCQKPSLLGRVPGGWKTLAVVLLAFVLGALFGGGDSSSASDPAVAATDGDAVKWYTCSMHPQIQLEDPKALCPICAMELIPVMEGGNDAGPRQLSMSEDAMVLAEVQATPVVREMVVKEVHLVGKIGYDETRMRTITAWVPGRLDRLYIDYTGVAVQKGSPLAYMYSPELLVAQEALLKADVALEDMTRSKTNATNIRMQQGTVKALEDRLRLWGLADDQIAAIRKRGSATDHMTVRSPISGIVIQKMAVEGDYVKVGQKILHIADLSRIWVYLDAYESDLAWIRYAQTVEFEAEAYPGEVFAGRISFIDPFLSEKTRTVKIRVNVDNLDGRLKPGMFVRARIHARLAEGGRIVEPSLAGKWISPAHPEVVMDQPGECPICGTPLVSAESLGYVGDDATAPLVVPATAPLRTGLRAVAYVRVPDTERPLFEGREIVLGPRTKHHYVVVSGLKEGELVVSHGAFKIDSALQIVAKPSMMSPPEGGAEPGAAFEAPESFLVSLNPLYQGAVGLQRSLAGDDLGGSKSTFAAVRNAADKADMGQLAGEAHAQWMALRARLIEHARSGAEATDIAGARVAFHEFSKAILEVVRAFGQATGVEFFESHCPMAFENTGASWLADDREILNPYFGESMLHCGSVKETFASMGERPQENPAFRHALTRFYDALLATQRGLSGDDLAAAKSAAASAVRALDSVSEKPKADWLVTLWSEVRGRAVAAAEAVATAADIEQARAAYERLNGAALALLRRFGHARESALTVAFCPMAFDNRGAAWVQEGDTISNPYFGASMVNCGEIRETFLPIADSTVPIAFRRGLARVVESYLEVGDALSGDDLEQAVAAAAAVDTSIGSVPVVGLEAAARARWQKGSSAMREAAAALGKATDLEAARRPFVVISDTLANVLAHFGHTGPGDIFEAHCPMAFSNRGANWIQRGKEIRNPYFGASMFRCGDVTRELPAEPKD